MTEETKKSALFHSLKNKKSQSLKRSVEKEIERRRIERLKVKGIDLKTLLFKEQYDFIKSKAKRIVACCSRRAGKTEACIYSMVNSAISNEEANILYVTLNRGMAKRIIWTRLKKILNTNNIKYHENNVDLLITFLDNGSTIQLIGAKDESAVENIRGLKLFEAYIDEAQSFKNYLTYLINDILSPCLFDRRGKLYMIGTPGMFRSGPFFDAFTNCEFNEKGVLRGWEAHYWTILNNTFLREQTKNEDCPEGLTPEQMLEETRKELQVDENDPFWLREYCGLWVEDANALVYKFNKDKNLYYPGDFDPTKHNYEYVMGIDLGYDDCTAIVIVAYSHSDPCVYTIDEFVMDKMDITTIAQQIKYFDKKYNPVKKVGDTGGLGKLVFEEISTRFGIHIEAAQKSEKFTYIELFVDQMRRGNIKCKPDSLLTHDWMNISWSKTEGGKKIISDHFHSDIADAELYAWRECPSYLQDEKESPLFRKSDDYIREKRMELRRKMIEEKAAGKDKNSIFRQKQLSDLEDTLDMGDMLSIHAGLFND